MAKKAIFCVGFDLPGDEFEYVAFESNRSLLDADIVLFEPTLGDYTTHAYYNGKSRISDHDSARLPQRLAHWRSELVAVVNAGKLAIVFLKKPEEAYRYTGRNEYSGTGRNRHVTNIVELVTSYAAVPNIDKVVAAEGTGVTVSPQAQFLGSYWKEVGSQTKYEVYIDGKFSHVLLQTKAGARTVGAMFRGKGNLLFLPPIPFPREKYLKWNKDETAQIWTADATKFGKRLSAAIVALAESLVSGSAVTPPPDWSRDPQYQLAQERVISEQIAAVDEQLIKLRKKRERFEQELSGAGGLRGLLYEQGRPLEAAILDALRTLGFTATAYREGESEFDAVFSSEEGRFIGEAEGKDNKAINVDKLSQLERNLQEDFARDDVTEFAKGVLFGNAQRLLPPAERGDAFTPKCISGAARAKIALVRTVDLFAPVKYLRDHPDSGYAKQCREAIFHAEGAVVDFPQPPITDEVTVAEASAGGTDQP